MDKHSLAVVVTIGFSVLGVAGDYLLKLASAVDQSSSIRLLLHRLRGLRLDRVWLGLRDEAPEAGHDRRRLLRLDDPALDWNRRHLLSRALESL